MKPGANRESFLYLITIRRPGKGDGLYAGITVDPPRRWAAHRQHAFKQNKQDHLYCAMRKYGADNCAFNVVGGLATWDEAQQVEVAWIAGLRASGALVYNKSDGGGGCTGYKFTPEQSARLAKAVAGKNRGRKASDATRQKLREATVRRWANWSEDRRAEFAKRAREALTEDGRRRISTASASRTGPLNSAYGKPSHNRGKKATDEQRAKMREAARRRDKAIYVEACRRMAEANRGKKRKPETIAKMSAARKRWHERRGTAVGAAPAPTPEAAPAR